MIRPATPADTAALLDLTAGTGFFKPLEVETLEGVLNDFFASNRDDYGHRAFVWEHDGRPLGYVYHAPEEMTDRTWYLWWIAVAADQQGLGIGGKLLAFAEADVRELGGRLLVVETSTTEHYEPTRQFYLKHGYTAAGRIADFYADGDGMAIFTKRLGAL
ncbi:acetyltransferase : Acetyltransferase OS=Singulisphaera acidiphila (strain ATCC BAA-1392 / DSM 18658 / VKM B-2454 / MOB10) GN=Sinac_5531 PE=4 SV=1: Acetyltransf_1 [Gemmata massiliana]|uniref:N-acetyltransferase domain-containing protein n=1 Tax=Gemmata massiliana TaxID=1210884 RepID=A0A6P2CTH4_9BACT|nr:GNAT family N-acetyltransferase [Gemmata massiliana]VTR92203.1 acetyltransferase : Acetyltransferase OS=Singulisphaera acidiphila (strain ATCC BAA-1392 / DSM 18658 / VKM B-2454 / MOB10) GN=Sinac_5531 PE=4 SV=1: Acetyltransf_1 [Gemmata massiliana]